MSMTTTGMLLGVVVSLGSSAVFCQSEPVPVDEKDAWAQPLLIFPPVFPKDVPAGMLPIEICVNGTVTTDGTFTSPVFTPAEGKEQFVQAVTDVIHHWRFRPAIEKDGCRTKGNRAFLIVYFEPIHFNLFARC